MAHFSTPLSDQVIVITGASSGIGRGVALACAERGATVVLASRQSDVLNGLTNECEKIGGQALAVLTDVSDNASVEALAETTLTHFGRIDGWINNAGVGAIGAFDTVPLADHEQVLKTNLFGTLYGSYAAVHHFKQRQSGILINIASMLGRVPSPYYAAYNASKSGIIALSATLRGEMMQAALDDIHICTVLPMALDTPFFQHAANYTGHEAVPIPPVYDVKKAIDAIVDLLENPQAETIIGGAGHLANAAHKIAPQLTEKLTGIEVQKVQMEAPVPTGITTGTLYHPNGQGLGIKKQEDATT